MSRRSRSSMKDTIKEAHKYIEMHEKVHNKQLQELLGFNPAKTAWCAGFVTAIEKACGREGTGSLLARSYLKYGTPVDKPEAGDIVILKRGLLPWQGHVGYYMGHRDKVVLVLGGNQSNKVCHKYYPLRKVLGYRRP